MAGIAVVLVALVSAMLTVAAPPAQAADAPASPVYAVPLLDNSCDAESTSYPAPDLIGIDKTVSCIPFGFATIRDKALCDAVGVGFWIPGEQLCAATYFRTELVDISTCGQPYVVARNVREGRLTLPAICAVPLLAESDPSPRASQSLTPICIEDPAVQDDPAAVLLTAGDTFASSSDGTNYLLITGDSTCSYGCYDGFDMNCDGKLGDYCPTEIDRRSVAGVAACRAAQTS